MNDASKLTFERINDDNEWQLIINYGLGFEPYEKSDKHLPSIIATNLNKLYGIPAIIKLNSNGNYTVNIDFDVHEDKEVWIFLRKLINSDFQLDYDRLIIGV